MPKSRKPLLTPVERTLVERAMRSLGEFLEPSDVEPFCSACLKIGIDPADIPGLSAPGGRPPPPPATPPATVNPTMTLKLGQSRYGSPEPRILIEWFGSVPSNEANAMLNLVAAATWAMRPPRQRWIVAAPEVLDESLNGTRAVIRIETVTGTQAEGEAALTVLEVVVSGYDAGRRKPSVAVEPPALPPGR